MIKYWCKVKHSDNIIIKTMYLQSLDDCQNGYKNRVYNVKTLLDNYGFSYVFDLNFSVDTKQFPFIFENRIRFYLSYVLSQTTKKSAYLIYNI